MHHYNQTTGGPGRSRSREFGSGAGRGEDYGRGLRGTNARGADRGGNND